MDKKQILALDSKKHVKIWLLHKLGMSRREIAEALGTNPGHVGNEIKSYEKNEDKRKAAEAMGGPTINEKYERQRLINAGMPDVAEQRYPTKKQDKDEANYLRAAKIPKGGAKNATNENLQAWSAESIATKHAMRPSAVFKWANQHGVNLTKYAYILYKPEANSALLSDVLNDKYSETKDLIEKSPKLKFPVYRNDSSGNATLVKYFDSHSDAERWINTEARQSDWYFFNVGKPIEEDVKKEEPKKTEDKKESQSFGERMREARAKKAAENASKSPEDLEYEKLMRILKQTNSIPAKELFAEFGIRDEQEMYGTAKRGHIFDKEYSQFSERKNVIIALKTLHVLAKLMPIKTTVTQKLVSHEDQHRYENGEDTESEYGVSRRVELDLQIFDKKSGEKIGALGNDSVSLSINNKDFKEAINNVKVYFKDGSIPLKPTVNFSKILSDVNKKAEEKKEADKWKTEKVPVGQKVMAKQDFEIWRQKTLKDVFEWLKARGFKRSHHYFDKAKEESLILKEYVNKLINYPVFYGMEMGYDVDKSYYKDSASITWQITANKYATKNKFEKEWDEYRNEWRHADLNIWIADKFSKEINPILGTRYSSSGYAYDSSKIGFSVWNQKSSNGSRLGKGGILEGPKHGDGGIKAKSPNGPLEVEGGEIIINAAAAKEHCEELSEINQSAGGGVAFPCDHPALDGIQGPMGGKGAKLTYGGKIGAMNTDGVKWFKDKAGRDRFEIDDSDAIVNINDIIRFSASSVKQNKTISLLLSDIITVWSGYINYPDLKNVNLVFIPNGDPDGALYTYWPDLDLIFVNSKYITNEITDKNSEREKGVRPGSVHANDTSGAKGVSNNLSGKFAETNIQNDKRGEMARPRRSGEYDTRGDKGVSLGISGEYRQELASRLFHEIQKALFYISAGVDAAKEKQPGGIPNNKIAEGVEVEKEHTDLYNELSQRLEADGHKMPMSKDEFFRMIAAAHIKEREDYYPLLKKYVEHAPSLMDKPYYLLTKEEVIACRDFIEMREAAGIELTAKCQQRLKDLARYSMVKFNTLIKNLK